MRQQPRAGLYLGTVHSAKGLEFRHVALLDGGWNQKQQQLEDERRLYYVGMTRAEETLTLCEFASTNAFTQSLGTALLQQSFSGQHDPALETQYQVFSMKDIDIGYPGRQPATALIHQAIQELKPGDSLHLHAEGQRYLLQDQQGRTVGCTSKVFRFNLDVETCEVAGIITRYAEDSEDAYRMRCKSERWEIVIPRVSGRRFIE
jgi:ATP-dependent DNA helicase RecQ